MKKIKRVIELKKRYERPEPKYPEQFYGTLKRLFGLDPRLMQGYAGWRIHSVNRDVILTVMLNKIDDADIGFFDMPNCVDVYTSWFSERYFAYFRLVNQHNLFDMKEGEDIRKRGEKDV